MHIVDATLFFAPHSGGVKRYLLAKHRYLRELPGVRHSLVVPGAKDAEIEPGIHTLGCARIPFGGGYRLPLRLAAWRDKLRALRPDVIEAGDPYHLAWSTLRVARELQVPIVAFAHSDLPRLFANRFGGWAGALADRYQRKLYARFDAVFAPSRSITDKLAWLGDDRLVRMPLGVDTTIFHPCRRDATLRAALGLANTTRLLVFAGRLAAEKQIPLLIDAVAKLGEPYHLLLVGGEKRMALNAHVTLLPYEDDSARLARLIASADAFVHAGAQETFGLVAIEAMACGRPVVGLAEGAIAELIDPQVGVLAATPDAAGIAAAIEKLYACDLDALGRNARARVEARFAWTNTFSAQLEHYRRLIACATAEKSAAIEEARSTC
jgi:alpha-1,6-mannosyltransferase